MFKRILVFKRILSLLLLLGIAFPAEAQQAPRSFIRDAEIENILRTFSTPLFQAAGLDPDAVKIHIVIDPSLNAFVANGQRLFIHTGLLIRTENVEQLLGVIAHETGHIAGGHLVRLQGAAGNATSQALLGMLLGAAAGVASKRGDVAAAVLMGSQEAAMRGMLSHSRGEEASADQAGVRFLEATGHSARGMLEFFNILGDQELLAVSRQDPYIQTHPLTRDRVSFVQEQVDHSRLKNAKETPQFEEMHKRMRAKLFGFLEPPGRTFQRYKETDDSIPSRYARAIAAYRKPDMPMALYLIDGLIAERPNDPYFHELKGQMLFENGRGRQALEPYRRAVALLPENALLHLQLAQIQVEQEDPALLAEAEKHLSKVVRMEPENYAAWQFLAIAYGRQGKEGLAAYAMGEQALLEGRTSDALFHAGKAEKLLPHKGPVWVRLQDIKVRAAQIREDR